jgi:hypothetical protein
MRLKCIGCDVLARPIYLCAARSPHVVDVTLFRRGLHSDPPDLRTWLQNEIDATGPNFDAIVMAYGLCGGATAGLLARSVPVVVPRAHDCITVFLGSRARYQTEFTGHPGTYWYVQDYLERDDGTGGALLGAGTASDDELKTQYEEYVAKYGKDNADYLMEALGSWQSHYDRAVLIDMGVADATRAETRARDEAARRGWTFERMAGQLDLVRRLLDGEWDDDYLVLQPGQRLAMVYDESVIGGETPEVQ